MGLRMHWVIIDRAGKLAASGWRPIDDLTRAEIRPAKEPGVDPSLAASTHDDRFHRC